MHLNNEYTDTFNLDPSVKSAEGRIYGTTSNNSWFDCKRSLYKTKEDSEEDKNTAATYKVEILLKDVNRISNILDRLKDFLYQEISSRAYERHGVSELEDLLDALREVKESLGILNKLQPDFEYTPIKCIARE